ncbi:MAG: glycosyltransferase [Candidatus Eremiobacteraeota bacterium]|nr:glycosyltransferase [Candidatus Eremiobacteraeota bacterium]MCL5054630.1 glycosyltransferase [Bacillota bacterium]
MAKPHILFVIEKWAGRNPIYGISNNEHNLVGSLESTGLATHECFYYDEYYYLHQKQGDEALLSLCSERKPDLIFLNWFPWPVDGFNLKLSTIYRLRANLQLPIVAIWWDSVWPQVMNMAECLSSIISFNIVVDSRTAFLHMTKNPEKYLPLWPPQDTRIYCDCSNQRDIDISFVGNRESYPDRVLGLETIRKSGIPIFESGGRGKGMLSVKEYASIFMRSKITLNFSKSWGQYAEQRERGGFRKLKNLALYQCKGRVFEATLCGAMLLEQENPEISSWFEPMVDYVPFNEKDCVEKIKYYLLHDNERLKIAKSGWRKATENYSSTKFWAEIFSRVNLNPKEDNIHISENSLSLAQSRHFYSFLDLAWLHLKKGDISNIEMSLRYFKHAIHQTPQNLVLLKKLVFQVLKPEHLDKFILFMKRLNKISCFHVIFSILKKSRKIQQGQGKDLKFLE